MRRLFLLLCLGLFAPFCQAQTLEVEEIWTSLDAEQGVFTRHNDEVERLLEAFRTRKDERFAAFELAGAIERIREHRIAERALLRVYACITDEDELAEAEGFIREHYWYLAGLIAMDAKFAEIVRTVKVKELAEFAAKIQADIQKVAERYRSLGRKPAYMESDEPERAAMFPQKPQR